MMKERTASSKMLHRKTNAVTVIVAISLLALALTEAGYSNGESSTPTATPTPAVTPSTGTSPTQTPTPTPIPTPTLTPTQEMPKPSVPEFTVELADSSYDVPTTYYMDTYGSGKNETRPGYHVESRTITVTIKNQPFTPVPISPSWNASLMYDIRVKVHNAENWTSIYHPSDGYPLADLGSEFTAISFQAEHSPEAGLQLDSSWRSLMFSVGEQIDFQVNAMIGYISRVFNPNATNQLEMYPYAFIGEKSGWSPTVTLTIPTKEPLLSVLSPQENSQSASNVSLTFSVDRPVSQFKYSLDGLENVTIHGNTTLIALPDGLHHVTVYAWDAKGNVGTSETIHFETASSPAPSPTSTPSPLPTQTGETPFVDPPEDTFSLLLLVSLAAGAIVVMTVIAISRKNSSGKTSSGIPSSLTERTMKLEAYRIIFFSFLPLVNQHLNSGHNRRILV